MTRRDTQQRYFDRPALLPVNQAESAYLAFYGESAQIDVTHGTSSATLRDRDGTLLFTGTVSDDGLGFSASFTVPTGTAIGSGYSILWVMDISGDLKTVRQAAIVVPYHLAIPCIAADWLRLHPNDTGYPSTQTDFEEQLQEAWTEMLWDLSSSTRALDADIWDLSKIRPLLIAKWERIVFRALATNIGAGRHSAEAEQAEAREKRLWQALTLGYDTDGDGDRDVVRERAAVKPFPPPIGRYG